MQRKSIFEKPGFGLPFACGEPGQNLMRASKHLNTAYGDPGQEPANQTGYQQHQVDGMVLTDLCSSHSQAIKCVYILGS